VMESSTTVGFDVDGDALEIARNNIAAMELTDSIDLVQVDIHDIRTVLTPSWNFDTVVMNPPFGTRNAGIDSLFLEKGMECANIVYSMHKTSTRAHFLQMARDREWNIEVVAELRYDLPKSYKFHKHKSKDIEVDVLRVSHTV